MGVNQVKGIVGEREVLAVGDLEIVRAAPAGRNWLRARAIAGRGEVDAGDVGAAFGEPGQIDAGAAADVENRSAAVAVKVHEPEQVMELLEMVLIEIVEKAARLRTGCCVISSVVNCRSQYARTSSIVATAQTITAAVSCQLSALSRLDSR